MLEGIHFSYDGVKSSDMGLINVQIDGGMFEETFLFSKEINEVEVAGRDKPYFQSVTKAPLEFELTFAFEDGYDERKIREVARWLNQDYYKPFYTTSNPNRIYYCMLEGDSTLIHTGIQQGYITLNMRCDSPFSYTPEYIKAGYKYKSTKLVKSLSEDTFNSGIGTFKNTKINSNGNIELKNANMVWSMLIGKKWSDL